MMANVEAARQAAWIKALSCDASQDNADSLATALQQARENTEILATTGSAGRATQNNTDR